MIPKGRKVSAKEATELLHSVAHTDDPEMSHAVMCQAYVMADGSALLVFEDGKGVLYESHRELVTTYRENVERAKKGPTSLGELLPQGHAFANEVPNVMAALPARLRLDPAALDVTEASLDAVDGALRKMSAKRMLAAETVAPLTAYVGEVIRRAIDGRWEMRLDADGQTWIPWIVDRAGWSCSPLRIYKELLEHPRSPSTRAFVAGTVGGRLLKRG